MSCTKPAVDLVTQTTAAPRLEQVGNVARLQVGLQGCLERLVLHHRDVDLHVRIGLPCRRRPWPASRTCRDRCSGCATSRSRLPCHHRPSRRRSSCRVAASVAAGAAASDDGVVVACRTRGGHEAECGDEPRMPGVAVMDGSSSFIPPRWIVIDALLGLGVVNDFRSGSDRCAGCPATHDGADRRRRRSPDDEVGGELDVGGRFAPPAWLVDELDQQPYRFVTEPWIDWSTVVSGGSVSADSGMLSKPIDRQVRRDVDAELVRRAHRLDGRQVVGGEDRRRADGQ